MCSAPLGWMPDKMRMAVLLSVILSEVEGSHSMIHIAAPNSKRFLDFARNDKRNLDHFCSQFSVQPLDKTAPWARKSRDLFPLSLGALASLGRIWPIVSSRKVTASLRSTI